MSQDQRKDRRVDVNQGIWVEGQEVRVHAEIKNISKGGMFVVAPQGVENKIGQTLEIDFEDPSEGKISLKMEVVWRDEKTTTAKLGLRALDSIGKAAFERVVTRYLDQAEEPAQSDGKQDEDDPSEKTKR
jgi:c-di-GMP-binding flagellar brake protein YcgR